MAETHSNNFIFLLCPHNALESRLIPSCQVKQVQVLIVRGVSFLCQLSGEHQKSTDVAAGVYSAIVMR